MPALDPRAASWPQDDHGQLLDVLSYVLDDTTTA
jgi:hypothetical protein